MASASFVARRVKNKARIPLNFGQVDWQKDLNGTYSDGLSLKHKESRTSTAMQRLMWCWRGDGDGDCCALAAAHLVKRRIPKIP